MSESPVAWYCATCRHGNTNALWPWCGRCSGHRYDTPDECDCGERKRADAGWRAAAHYEAALKKIANAETDPVLHKHPWRIAKDALGAAF